MAKRRAARSDPADVFISHIHEESEQARALATYLLYRMQVTSFLATSAWDLVGGEEWLARIRRELRGCRMALSLLSSQSILRPWIHFEAGAAWALKKPVVPCAYGGLFKGALPAPFSSMQAYQMPEDLMSLEFAVAKHLGIAPPPPLAPTDADHHYALWKAVGDAFAGKGFHPPDPETPER